MVRLAAWGNKPGFAFKLERQRGADPAIIEPAGSVTFDLSPVFGARDEAEFLEKSGQVNEIVFASFRRVFDETTHLAVLDWQHPAYRYWPHRAAERCPVQPFPDGDYYVFLTEDMAQGTFGHPWEQTLCVFGDDLLRDLVPNLQLPVRRSQPRIVSMTSGERSGADSETA